MHLQVWLTSIIFYWQLILVNSHIFVVVLFVYPCMQTQEFVEFEYNWLIPQDGVNITTDLTHLFDEFL
jgi:hypothetical protein